MKSIAENKDISGKSSLPRSVIFILINILIERYCSTSTLNILVVYLNTELGFDENTTTALYHASDLLTYIFPTIAAIFFDSYFGLFKNLISMCVVFAMGSLILSIGAVELLNSPRIALTLIGMFLFVAGGSVRSSLSTFGADQCLVFEESNHLKKFFFFQILFIKVGAMLGRFTGPVLREDVKCFENDSCYPLAFGFPATLTLFGMVILLCSKSNLHRKSPSGNLFVKVIGCMFYALKIKLLNKKDKRPHWLDYAKGKFEPEIIDATKQISRTLIIFASLIIYFSCFMQQNSRWVFQATQMNGDIGFYKLKPDQIIMFNPIFALILTPICNYIIYPLLSKCKMDTLLHRMAIGGFLTVISFILVIIVEIRIQKGYISMLWLVPQYAVSAFSEIFTLVSLMNFAYAESPKNMKSVMMSLVFLTIAGGHLFISVISGSKIFNSRVTEFSFFGCALFVNMIIFCIVMKRYKYANKETT